ncbi:MAG TPA: hypothetical protein DFI00_13060 [Rhodospirillaceae bacterium]|nr:hypothetical protein [Alphaproteobacteria bacterium]OUT41017.1 MAG: 3-hydroxyacyl-[acyl-carrier-protein] dehydratase FabA [Micavibrio sp. TMED2]HCI48216.1 hypothetical protein [Rhodospirillaceae bacterium]MAS47488.1 hypothetical protein [Alphaproteobacteria bacterium]MAX96640.1 hypothetical protein [Alphaproteobacteria bacterium]|tara:strand:- start:7243 stop:7770 length:528 start_codon:yes stop_codon:yes gene_type:complete
MTAPTHDSRTSFDYDDLISCGHGTLFANPYPKLPLPPMLMFDRIAKVSADGGANGKGFLIAELDVKPDLWFFGCHFEGDPVMPGCLGLDALWQLVGFYLGWMGATGAGRALGVGEVKFTDQVLPTIKKVTYRLDFKRVINRKLVMGIADGTVHGDDKLMFEASGLKVGLFEQTGE